MIKFLKDFLLDLLYPKLCFGCQKEGNWVCDYCYKKISINGSSQVFLDNKIACIDRIFAASDYQQDLVKHLIHHLKYSFVKELGLILGQVAVDYCRQLNKFDYDVVIAVPLAKKRLVFRSFNQSELIVEQINNFFKLKNVGSLLVRSRYTRPQVGLNKQERLKNLQGAFSVVNRKLVENKKILLVDDVLTTGATLKECAKTLKSCGAASIDALVIAKD